MREIKELEQNKKQSRVIQFMFLVVVCLFAFLYTKSESINIYIKDQYANSTIKIYIDKQIKEENEQRIKIYNAQNGVVERKGK